MILYIKSFLFWDERVAMNYAKDLKTIILNHYQEKSWAVLHNGTDWELPTPEGRRLLTQMKRTWAWFCVRKDSSMPGPDYRKNFSARNNPG